MNGVWTVILLAAAGCAAATGRGGETGTAILSCGGQAVQLALTVLGTMTLWSGMLSILEATGDVRRLGRALRRILRPLFPRLRDDLCWETMGLNLSANLLGLGNAATPAGIRAASLLAEQGQDGRNALAMLLVLNNSSLQLMPATVMSLRAAAGSAAPASIWPASLAATAASTLAAALLMRLAQRKEYRDG